MIELRILPEVFEDAAEAAHWYDGKEPDLGDRFLDSFRSIYDPLRKNPLAHRIVYRQHRKMTLNSFPYAVYFRMHNNAVIVTLLCHLARNPAVIRRALRAREKPET